MKYAYYPGCSALGSSEDYERSTQAVCGALGAKLVPVPDWNCCGSTPAHAVSTELSAALCVRNLSLAGQMDCEGGLLTSCPSCLANLKTAAHRMEDSSFRHRVEELLDAPAASFPRARFVIQMLLEDFGMESLARRTSRPLLGVRLVPYYGCLMSRPAEIMQFGNPEHPMAMEEALWACGAEDVVDFPAKTECCGASHGIPSRQMTARLSGGILSLAADYGADALVVACPLCQMNLDLRQEQAAKAVGLARRIPVLYFTQAMGLAFGLDPSHLGLEKLCVSAQPLLDKIQKARGRAVQNAYEAGTAADKNAKTMPKAEVRS